MCSVSTSVWVFSALSLLKGIEKERTDPSASDFKWKETVTEAYGPFLGVKPQVYVNSGATC